MSLSLHTQWCWSNFIWDLMKTGITWEEQNVLCGLQPGDSNSTLGKKGSQVPLSLVSPMWDPGNKSLQNLTGKPQMGPVHQVSRCSLPLGAPGCPNLPTTLGRTQTPCWNCLVSYVHRKRLFYWLLITRHDILLTTDTLDSSFRASPWKVQLDILEITTDNQRNLERYMVKENWLGPQCQKMA